MLNELHELRNKRLKWVEANRENNFEEGIKRLLTDLYPDNAHFIYELLQNAEDPKASIARFTLTQDALEFEHNGPRLFDIKDVDSITSIGTSTKRDDPTSIGKFGVGFKAVFAYTSTPEIYSGNYHFRIHDLVVPQTDESAKLSTGKRDTRFVFPFDHPTKRAAQAVEEIERTLNALGDNTLLFLSHIRKVEYLLPDGSLGALERIDHSDGHIEIRSRRPGGSDTISHWLRFQKDVEITDDDGQHKACRIAIAYRLEKNDAKNKGATDWKIVPLDHGQVSIYFPAEKETSNLRFHIHAPFASTVARDSVRDSEANRKLRDNTADLVVESLTDIRDRGMLTMGFLAVLPNDADGLPLFYQPIQQAIVSAFKKEPLTPTRSRSHAAAARLYRGPVTIARVLEDEGLSLLTNQDPPLWAANPPQQNQREDRFLDSLDIDTWGWEELSLALDIWDEDVAGRVESWIAQKSDTQLMQLYGLFGEACEAHDGIEIANVRIIRVAADSDERHHHVLPEEAYLQPQGEVVSLEGIRFVKPSVFSSARSERQKNLATLFLENVGVRVYDTKAVIELRLAEYDREPPPLDDTYIKDLKKFIAYWKKNPTAEHIFRGHDFLVGCDQNGDLFWHQPGELCLDGPYEKTGLSEFLHIHHKNVLWDEYKQKLSKFQLKDFLEFVKALGVLHELVVESVNVTDNSNKKYLYQDWMQAYVRQTYTRINRDYTIPNLAEYLRQNSVCASRLIWSALLQAGKEAAIARFRPNQQYPTRESSSQLVQSLKDYEWIPDKEGVFRSPEDMTQDDLRTDFPYDDRNGLLTAIGFGEKAKKQSEIYRIRSEKAQNMGFGSVEEMEEAQKITEFMRENGMTSEDIQSLVRKNQRTSQPEESVPNPERRRKGVLERRENAPTKESVTRERAIQPGAGLEIAEAKAYLRVKYKNTDGQLVCQCCREEMPFKIKDDHYFEAVQCVRNLDKYYFENRLALCPTCAAMYRHARDTSDEEIQRLIIDHQDSGTTLFAEIPISLAGREFQLRFVGTHWFDFKTVLQEIG